jgi:hypothetical protein
VLKLGLGRAIPFLRKHDARPCRDIILDACMRWTGYDQQVEGARTTYLRDVLDATGHEPAFVPRILAALKKVTERRDATQLVFLALSFAEDGYDAARTALYETFDRNDTDEPFLGYDAIIRLDGLDGLLHIADRVGAALLDSRDVLGENDWVLMNAIREAQEQCGVEDIRPALERAAQENPRIRAYVNAIKTIEAEEAAQHTAQSAARGERATRRDGGGASRGAPYEHIKQRIAEASPPWSVRGLMRWGEQAGADDLARAAADLLAEQDERRLRAYLEIFRRRPFPLDVGHLLELTRHPNDRIMVGAASALSWVAHPSVRALALEIITDSSLGGWRKSWGVLLLRSNFETGDAQLLAHLLESPQEEMGYHSIGFEIVNVLRANPVPEVVPVLRLLYERGPCTNCRMEVVELLRQLGALTDWILEECRYDASEYLRTVADAWARGEEPPND